MRLAVVPFVAFSLACFLVPARFGDEREACEIYLDCVTAVDAEAAGGAVAVYGADGACWGSREDAERCAAACDLSRSELLGRFPAEDACLAEGQEAVTLADIAADWRIESGPGECGEWVLWARTTPVAGDEFDVELSDSEDVTADALCTADGLDFACDDVHFEDDGSDLVFSAITGEADPSFSTLTLELELSLVDAAGEFSCGEYTAEAYRLD